MGAAAPIMMIASTAAGVAGQAVSGMAESRSASQQAAMAGYNASVLEANANAIEIQNKEDIKDFKTDFARFQGQQRALTAKSGTTGVTSNDIFLESAINAELDAIDLEYQGKMDSYNMRTKAFESRNLESALKAKSKNSLLQTGINATGTILGTAGSFITNKARAGAMSA